MKLDYYNTFEQIQSITEDENTTTQILRALNVAPPAPEPKPEPTARERYEGTHAYGVLTGKHNIQTETGTWMIYGEDPNCDFGGFHHEPYLATIEGRLTDVIDYAVTLKGFWGWGGGGRIEKIEVKKV
jgi:hypothetical protein